MAPTKRVSHTVNHNNPALLHEIISIRNTIKLAQQTLSRMEKSMAKSPSQVSTVTRVTARQSLVTKLYNVEPPKRVCWYHKNFGVAALPTNCPGPEECSFVPPKKPITTGISKRLQKPETQTAPKQSISPKPTYHSVAPPTMDWSQQSYEEEKENLPKAIHQRLQSELEDELLDLSD